MDMYVTRLSLRAYITLTHPFYICTHRFPPSIASDAVRIRLPPADLQMDVWHLLQLVWRWWHQPAVRHVLCRNIPRQLRDVAHLARVTVSRARHHRIDARRNSAQSDGQSLQNAGIVGWTVVGLFPSRLSFSGDCCYRRYGALNGRFLSRHFTLKLKGTGMR